MLLMPPSTPQLALEDTDRKRNIFQRQDIKQPMLPNQRSDDLPLTTDHPLQ
jgi:hypothetical protein